MPAEGDADMAGAPANSEATISATDEEIQLMLHPRVIGNPTNMEWSDEGLLRGSPRDVRYVSERIQYEPGHDEDFRRTFVASAAL
eukprot:6237601-Pyramimonas_sp.AAC.1